MVQCHKTYKDGRLVDGRIVGDRLVIEMLSKWLFTRKWYKGR